jgi:hypothetical protein
MINNLLLGRISENTLFQLFIPTHCHLGIQAIIFYDFKITPLTLYVSIDLFVMTHESHKKEYPNKSIVI